MRHAVPSVITLGRANTASSMLDSQLAPRLYLDTVANPEKLRAIARSVLEREFKHKGLLPVAPLQIGSLGR